VSDPSPMAPVQSGAPFEVGATLSCAIKLFAGGFARFLVLALIPLLPLLLVEVAKSNGSLNEVQGLFWTFILAFFLSYLANAAILYGAMKEMRGENFTIGQSFGVGLARTLPIFGVAFCVALAMAIAAIALIFPAFVIMCMMYVAIPACVIENLGVFASMGRSSDLTRGYRWPIFGLILIFYIIAIVLDGLAGLTVGMAGGKEFSWLLSFGLQVTATAFESVLATVIYHNLRVAKEGVDVSKITKTFD
jgi:hypothetical protein